MLKLPVGVMLRTSLEFSYSVAKSKAVAGKGEVGIKNGGHKILDGVTIYGTRD